MPKWTNRDFLAARGLGPEPDGPPWRVVGSAEVCRWMNTSVVTLCNWRREGTGPAYRFGRHGWAEYTIESVRAWIENRDPDPVGAARAYLSAHRDTLAAWAAAGCKGLARARIGEVRDLRGRLDALSDEEVTRLVKLVDAARLFGVAELWKRRKAERRNTQYSHRANRQVA